MTIKENVEHKTSWEELLNSPQMKGQKSVIWDYRHKDMLETFWISDVHLGHRQCNEDRFKRNLDFIQEREMPFADLGDLIENATRDSVGAGVYEQEAIADAQIERAEQYYKPFADKRLLKAMLIGNHELRSFIASGMNPTRLMAKHIGVPYGGFGCFHVIKVGKERYTVYSSHGGSAATTTGGKFNALKRIADNVQADIVIMGHVHEPIFHSRLRFNTNGQGKVTKEVQYLVSNGAYLDWWGSYGQVKAYSPNRQGNAKINLLGDRKQIEVSFT